MRVEQQMDNLSQGSSFVDGGYGGYFNSSKQQWSNLLYSPTANDCEDLFVSSTRQLPNSHHVGWFTVKRHLFVPTLELPVNLNSPVEENSNRRHVLLRRCTSHSSKRNYWKCGSAVPDLYSTGLSQDINKMDGYILTSVIGEDFNCSCKMNMPFFRIFPIVWWIFQ